MEVSAKESVNVEKAFMALAQLVYENKGCEMETVTETAPAQSDRI